MIGKETLIAKLMDLAEGRETPETWRSWWDEHEPELETLLNRGEFLKLKPCRHDFQWVPMLTEQAGFEGAEAVPRLLTIWEKYVSEKPRPGYRPLGLSYSAQGTYNGEDFLDAEQITKNKLYIYTREKNTGFDRRFLMKRVGEGWKIDAVQERLNGWQRTEV